MNTRFKTIVTQYNQLNSKRLHEIHALRARVFAHRLGWQVQTLDDLELDEYDALNPFYLIFLNKSGAVCGCTRLLPTTGSYMLKDSFPSLLGQWAAPTHPAIWELSRFTLENPDPTGYGFSRHVMGGFAQLISYARDNAIAEYLFVTTPAIERLLRTAGVKAIRLNTPSPDQHDGAVALKLDIVASISSFKKAWHRTHSKY